MNNFMIKQKSLIKINFKIKSFHYKTLIKNLTNIEQKSKFLKLYKKNIAYLPTKLERYTVLRSPHIDKKSREQFERKIYNRVFSFFLNKNSLKKLKIFLIFLKNNSSGCQIKITYYI